MLKVLVHYIVGRSCNAVVEVVVVCSRIIEVLWDGSRSSNSNVVVEVHSSLV